MLTVIAHILLAKIWERMHYIICKPIPGDQCHSYTFLYYNQTFKASYGWNTSPAKHVNLIRNTRIYKVKRPDI